MKTLHTIITTVLLLSCIALMVENYNLKYATPVEDNSIHFVWNDDEESIPCDGSLVKIEMTDENTIYLTPIN